VNCKCVEQRCGKREIRKTDYDVALQVGENPMLELEAVSLVKGTGRLSWFDMQNVNGSNLYVDGGRMN